MQTRSQLVRKQKIIHFVIVSLKDLEEKLNETLLSLYYTHGFFGLPAIFPVINF
jgi:hypothetical protein